MTEEQCVAVVEGVLASSGFQDVVLTALTMLAGAVLGWLAARTK